MRSPALAVARWPRAVSRATGAGVTHVGRLTLLVGRLAASVPHLAWHELLRNLWRAGAESLALSLATAVTTGLMMVLQTSAYVRAFGIAQVMGWATGYATLREFVPLTVGIVFSGRVAAAQASELAALRTGEQLDALEALGVDVTAAILAQRFFAMALALVLVTGLCDLTALATASLFTYALIDVPPPAFFESLAGTLTYADALEGFAKSLAYGTALGLMALTAGLAARRGAHAVGDAARRAVVGTMVSILVLDALLSGGAP